MVFSAPESLQAGKPDMSKAFRKPKNPVNSVNINGNNAIAKHKKKNKKWKGINNKNTNPNSNNSTIAMVPAHFNNGLIARPRMMPMMMTWMGGHHNSNNNGILNSNVHNSGLHSIHNPGFNNNAGHNSTEIMSRNGAKRRRILTRYKKVYHPTSASHAPLAPRNTTSFIMRAKQHGGIASAVTPSPATLVRTPLLSPGMRDKGSLEEMNKELGVDGYGSMNGLIRLRSYDDRAAAQSETESDVEQGDNMANNEEGGGDPTVHSVEQRIDQGLSRFEMIYPSSSSPRPPSSRNSGMLLGVVPRNIQNCVNGQERLIARLEEENLTLKERLFLVEQERNELRRRVQEMEGLNHAEDPLEEHFEESCGDVSTPCEQ